MIVVLGDADDGTRLLAGDRRRDRATSTPPQVIVNDAIRDGRQAIQALTPGVPGTASAASAPVATSMVDGGPEGFFAANAVDCVNLIALAAIQAGSDDPGEIAEEHGVGQRRRSGRASTFADCAERLGDGLQHRLQRLLGRRRAVDHRRASSSGPGSRRSAFDDDGVDHRLDGRRSMVPDSSGELRRGFVDVVEVADVEAARTRRRAPTALVEPHRVHDVLDDLEVVGEQRDAPLEVVEPGRAGDRAAPRCPANFRPLVPCSIIMSRRSLERRGVPVGVRLAALAHRVEAERRLALPAAAAGRAASRSMCSGMPLAYSLTSVMRQVAVDDVEPGALQRGLQLAQRRARRAPSAITASVGTCGRGSTP